ncbi:MAG TPA: hypothetical protein VHA82_09010 [Ramlibacter sp.]|uniref:hypothetical protein n=1 Tax=Ramlibacter sp. TaxID=1917967 RepID=UPI002C166863|nr:hypothetical protein [Ramlibacter sp.]HVZ43936.1 hypothetical protein [Ramlibacter sp.]
MARTCIRCGYTRSESDTGADYACPACGVVYAKAEAAHAQEVALAQARARATAAAQAAAAKAAASTTSPGTSAHAQAEAMMQQLLLSREGEHRRKGGSQRGMALVALVAFSTGFAAAAGLYAGSAKLGSAASCATGAKQIQAGTPAGSRPRISP